MARRLTRAAHHRAPAPELEPAARLLLSGRVTAAQAARRTGWGSAAELSRALRRHLHVGAADLIGWRRRGSYRLRYPGPFHLQQTLRYLGRDAGNLAERVSGRGYTRYFPVAGRQVLVTLRLAPRHCTVLARPPRSAAQALRLHGLLVRFLGLDQPLAKFYRAARRHPVLRRLVREFHGVRIPQVPGLWEALCWAVVGQQINLAFAYKLRNRLIALANAGAAVALDSSAGTRADAGLQPFPTPRQVLRLTPQLLREHQFSRQKADYVLGIARAFESGALAELEADLQAGRPAGSAGWEQVERLLLEQRGLGPWSVAYALLRSLGHWDALPIGDSGLRAALRRQFKLAAPPTVAEQLALMEPFRPYRGLATYYLWKSLASPAAD